VTTLLLVFIFAFVATAAYLVLAPSTQSVLVKQRALAIRRQGGFIVQDDGTLMDEEMALPFVQRVLGPVLEMLSGLLLKNAPHKVQAGIQQKLVQAGNPLTPSRFLLVQVMAAAGMGLAGLAMATKSMAHNPLMGVVLLFVPLLLGWRGPEFWLSKQIAHRRRLIDKALPDVLDLLSVSVEAGLGLDGAIQKVGEKFPEPTAGEFRELLKAVRLGTPRVDALRALADRSGLPDMRTFTAAVIQADQLGVAISRVLRAQSEALRIKRKQKAEEKAMALPIKMLFPMIIFIFPTIFIIVLGPVLLTLMGGLGL
jgi:tight adherence protein C